METKEEQQPAEAPVRKRKRWLWLIRNKYLLATLFFLVWMLFFDNNNWFYLKRLSDEARMKRHERAWYQREIKDAEQQLQELTTDLNAREKFGRETYQMKKKNEDVYIFREMPDDTTGR